MLSTCTTQARLAREMPALNPGGLSVLEDPVFEEHPVGSLVGNDDRSTAARPVAANGDLWDAVLETAR
jgi:hypothetical protein